MSCAPVIAFILLIGGPQNEPPPYIAQGNRIERQFREYHAKLNVFYRKLRLAVLRDAPELAGLLEEEPPKPILYGYQLLPKLFDEPADTDQNHLASRSYSWPATEKYVRGEDIKLELANIQLDGSLEPLEKLAGTYRELVANEKTVDQHIEYNRFWQRAVAMDRGRYDRLTEIFNMLRQNDADVNRVIREALGTPDVPSFIRVARSDRRIRLHVPIYTDIDDDAFLSKAKSVIEEFWQAGDDGTQYSVEVEWKKVSFRNGPRRGAHIDLRAHAAAFPKDGAALTTGAESTHAVVGRFIALGAADTSYRTIAHEFGHILGFRDGYVRGYRDLGSDGFEIMEITPNFDDLMSAPRQGRVQTTHFKLLLK